MLEAMFARLIQHAFLPPKTPPKQSWRESLSRFGKWTATVLPEGTREITTLHLRNPAHEGPAPIAILAHPVTRQGKYFFKGCERVAMYSDLGFDVVVFDFNGFGESPHNDLRYWRDVEAVIRHFAPRSSQMIYHGVCFGAFHAIRALDLLPARSSVIIENMPRSLQAYWGQTFKGKAGLRCLELLCFPGIHAMDIERMLREFKRTDVLIQFVACDRDEISGPDEMQALYQMVSVPTEFTTFPSARRLFAPAASPEMYLDVLRRAAAHA